MATKTPLVLNAIGDKQQLQSGDVLGASITGTSSGLAGGVAGSLPYQTAVGVTGMLSIGSTGQVLTVVGGLPSWTADVYNPAAVTITGGSITGTSIGNTNPSTGVFTTSQGGTTTNGLIVQAFTGAGGYGAIYNSSITPSDTNFAIAASSTMTLINATSTVALAINNTALLTAISTGITIPTLTNTTFTSTAATFGTTTNGLIAQSYTNSSGYGAIYNSAIVPSNTNFGLAIGATSTVVNATGSVALDISNVNILNVTSTGVSITGTLSSNGITSITSTTASTLSSNGALVISGGLGVAGASNFGSSLTTTGVMTSSGFIANKSISSSSSTGAFSYGTLSFSDINIVASYQANVNTYVQTIIQNTNAGTSASVDYVVNNNLSTSGTYYGAFGMNSSAYAGSGNIRNLPNTVYLESSNGDLAIGTLTANAIHFITNTSATDAMTISSTGTLTANYLTSLTAGIASTSQTSGTLCVTGGIGATGSIYSLSCYATNTTSYATAIGASSSSSAWNSVAYGTVGTTNYIVAVSNTSGTLAQYSTNGGTTFTASTLPSTATWSSVCYGNNLFVAVANGGSTAAAYSSNGGATWTASTLPTSTVWSSVAYGNGMYVAVATGTSNGAYSANAAVWGASTLPSFASVVAYGNGYFVTASSGGQTTNYSTNGTSWTAGGTMTAVDSWNSLVYGNGTFVAMSSAAGDNLLQLSTNNGITWTSANLPSTATWTSLTFSNGVFFAVASGGTVGVWSLTGSTGTWNTVTLPASASWKSVISNNLGVFTAIATGSTSVAIVTINPGNFMSASGFNSYGASSFNGAGTGLTGTASGLTAGLATSLINTNSYTVNGFTTNGYLNFTFNAGTLLTYPFLASTLGGSLGSNFSNNQAEVNFWNNYWAATTSFNWRQSTAASTATSLMSLSPTGILTLPTTGSLSVGGATSTHVGSALFSGNNAWGGTNYHGFMQVTNTYNSGTNKYFRLNPTGNLEIVNSAYSSVIFGMDDSGNLNTYTGSITTTNVTASGGVIYFPTGGYVQGNNSTYGMIYRPSAAGSNYNHLWTDQTGTGQMYLAAGGNLSLTGSISSKGVIGYGPPTSGIGGTVTQATSRSTGVTLSKLTGAITLFAAAPVVGTWVTFTVTNTTISTLDVVNVSVKSGTNTYVALVSAVAAGSFDISFQSISGTASDSPVINFVVMQGQVN